MLMAAFINASRIEDQKLPDLVLPLIGRTYLAFMLTGFWQIAEIKAELLFSIWRGEGGKKWPAGFKANHKSALASF